jgi:ribose transport system substrate-binding protein
MFVQVRSFLLLVVLGALFGCSGKPSAPEAGGSTPETKLAIAVIPKGSMHEFWKAVHAGANKAAEELGVEIIFKGPQQEGDREEQIKIVEGFTTQRVSGIVLAPLDDTALRMPVKNAQDAGIPVLIIDSGLKDIETVSFVATDNYVGGKLAGERMAQLMSGGQKNVILLRYQEGSASTDERERGFLDAVKAAPNIKLLSDNQYAGATQETAQKTAENLIQSFKNADGSPKFDGIFCPNESSTAGMLKALQDAGLAGKVKLLGFDSSPKLIEGLESGQIDGLVLQDPFNMGYMGVKTLVEKLRGGTPVKRIDTGATLVDKANMGKPEMQKLLSPPRA